MNEIWPQIAGIAVAVVAVFGGIVGMTKWVVKESSSAADKLYGRLKETEFKNLNDGIAKVETTLEKRIADVRTGLEKQIAEVKTGWAEGIEKVETTLGKRIVVERFQAIPNTVCCGFEHCGPLHIVGRSFCGAGS